MFRIFSNKKEPRLSAQPPLAVDMHSHLIPALDDGVETGLEAQQLLIELMNLGFRKFITTPHIFQGEYNNSAETILPALDLLRSELAAGGLTPQISAAAEYFCDEYFLQSVEKNELITFGGRYVLFELPFTLQPPGLQQTIFRMNVLGYQPVLAHPERYFYLQDPQLIEIQKLRDAGVLMQLNVMSLSRQYGAGAMKCARKMIDLQLYDFAGTDIHRLSQLEALKKAMADRYYHRLLASGKLLNNQL